MRRRNVEQDSLDLLLDTVCNVFGGIIFIAMLVAVLAVTRSSLVPAERGISADEFRQTLERQAALVTLRSRIDQLKGVLEEVDHLERTLLSGHTEEPSVEAMEEMADLIENAEARLQDGRTMRDRLQESQSDVAARIDSSSDRSEALQEEVESLEKQIQAAVARRTTEARLPVRRKTEKAPFHLILSAGRMFALARVDRSRKRVDWSTAEDRDVTLNRVETVSSFELRYTLRPDGGFPVTDDLRSHPRWQELVRSLPSSRYFISFAVYPDSYESFLQAKQAALASGFQYEIIVYGTGDRLIFVPGEDFTVQ